MKLKYLSGYNEATIESVKKLVEGGRLKEYILSKFPKKHSIRSDKELYEYTTYYKNKFLKNIKGIDKVTYTNKLTLDKQVLGYNAKVSRKQGNKLKSKSEIHISKEFRDMPEEFLRVIVVHELAHLKVRNHEKEFYKLTEYMERDYHILEFQMRLYLTYIDIYGEKLYL